MVTFRVASLWNCKIVTDESVRRGRQSAGITDRAHLEDVRLGTCDRAERLSDEVRDLIENVDLRYTPIQTRQPNGYRTPAMMATYLFNQSALADLHTGLHLEASLDLLARLSDLFPDPLELQPSRSVVTRLGVLGRRRMRRPANITRRDGFRPSGSVDGRCVVGPRLAAYDERLTDLGRVDAADVGFDPTGFGTFCTVIVRGLKFHLDGSDASELFVLGRLGGREECKVPPRGDLHITRNICYQPAAPF